MNAILKSAGGVVAIAVAGAYVMSERVASQPPAPPAAAVRPAPVAAAPQPARPQRAAGNVVEIKAGRGGHYVAEFEINGRRIPMLVDTGASVIALSYEDAVKVGLTPFPSDYTIPMSTANGTVRGARRVISEVRIDTILVRDVPAVVMPPGALSGSLLGMSFLQRLSGFQVVEGGRLQLKP